MAKRMVKCQTCENRELYVEREEKMEAVEKLQSNGRMLSKYYHKGECFDEYLKKQGFKDQERKEQNELDAVIKEIHGLKANAPLPHTFWIMIQDMRNGTARYTHNFKRSYKKGVPYNVLKDAYLMARKDIEWAKLSKQFKTTSVELKYCLKIAHDKINDVYKEREKVEQSKRFADAKEQMFIENYTEDKVVEYKKKEPELDMSDFLDD